MYIEVSENEHASSNLREERLYGVLVRALSHTVSRASAPLREGSHQGLRMSVRSSIASRAARKERCVSFLLFYFYFYSRPRFAGLGRSVRVAPHDRILSTRQLPGRAD